MQITNNIQILIQQLINIIYSPLNRLLILACSSQIASMLTKAIISSIKNKKFSLKNMSKYGGMPSSHTVFVTSIIFGIAFDKNFGWQHPLLTFGIVISSVVLTDAVRLRGTVDKLNNTLKEVINNHDELKDKITLPKHIAHTPLEVVVGIGFAFVYTLFFYALFYSIFPS